MAHSTLDSRPRLTALYAILTAQWARQTVEYSRSVRLYNARVSGPRLRRLAGQAGQPEPRDEAVRPLPGPVAAPSPNGGERTGGKRRCPLTARQREIADLIAQGLTNGQIAARIVVSRGTVGNHIGHMLRRLGVNNRAQIAAWAIRHVGEGFGEDRGGALPAD
jgi:DNA-binding CsgD family transcriptional regulator